TAAPRRCALFPIMSNVFKEAHRCVPIGVFIKRRFAQLFVELGERVGAVLVVFPDHRLLRGLWASDKYG
ncbi:MAG: hypothetical protein ACREAB_00090, partial [Blastocatellia bacterium]